MLLRAHAQHIYQARCRQEHGSPHRSPQKEFSCRPNLCVSKRNVCSLSDTASAATSLARGPYANPEMTLRAQTSVGVYPDSCRGLLLGWCLLFVFPISAF